ncbi:MAG: hypothetical protein C0514_05705 [Candidatus Puniceispirillum sp.]|nr:hypothetical protein [Candidatus Puniceispirillum sp.]
MGVQVRISFFVLSLSLILSGSVLSSEDIPLEELGITNTQTLLPKAHASHWAFLKREVDYHHYLLGIQSYFKGENISLDQDDPIFQILRDRIGSDDDEKIHTLSWLQDSLEAVKSNMRFTTESLVRIRKTTTHNSLRETFAYITKSRAAYFVKRAEAQKNTGRVVATSPDALKQHNALSRRIAQNAIDKHALMSEAVKEAYKALVKIDPQDMEYLPGALGINTAIVQYMTGSIKTIPDPDSCVKHDWLQERAAKIAAPAASQPLEMKTVGSRIQGTPAQQRLKRELEKRRGAHEDRSLHQHQESKAPSASSSSRPGASTLALIKEDIAQKKKALAAQAQEKARNAAYLKDQILGTVARKGPVADLGQDEPFTLSHSMWVAPDSHEKEKTRGVADATRQQKKKQRAKAKRALQKQEADTGSLGTPQRSSQTPVDAPLKASLYKRLVNFWGAKAGQTYHDVEILFKGFGGEIIEKSGGSSHVTLVYHVEGKPALKHELWRPHGGGNAFGFKTTAGLQDYLQQCGLTVPSSGQNHS